MKEILLTEYRVLKSEQLDRIKHRDNIIYVLLGAVGTLFSFAIIHKAVYVVAIVPMISFVLCWLYLANDRKISEIGNYISVDLTNQITEITDGENKIFQWEKAHRAYKGRKIRKLTQFIVDLLVFTFPALGGILMVSIQNNNYYIIISDMVFFIGIIVLFIIHYSNKKITQEEPIEDIVT